MAQSNWIRMHDGSITVLLVDDHSLVTRAFRRMLEDEPDLRVVGEANDGHKRVETALPLRPDVVVMNFALPGMMGAVAAQNIAEALPGTPPPFLFKELAPLPREWRVTKEPEICNKRRNHPITVHSIPSRCPSFTNFPDMWPMPMAQ
jgi:response regulator RpfG family c-di-GMP phosphodiesterase